MASLYSPAAKWRTRAAAGVAAATVGAAAAAAIAGHGVARLYAFLLVLPAAQGAVIGLACAWAIRRARLAHPLAALAIAAVAATGALAGQALLDFRAARATHVQRCDDARRLRLSIGAADGDGVAADFRECVDRARLGPFLSRRVGLVTGEPDAEDRGAALGSSGGALVVAVLELLIALGIAGGLARAAAAEPACEQCGAWRVERALGRAAQGIGSDVVRALLDGDATGAAQAIAPPDTREESRLAVLSCPRGHDAGGGVLRVTEERVSRRRRLVSVRIADVRVDEAELAAIAEAFDG